MTRSFNKVLIANRGEIACRIICTCRAMGYATVAVYTEVDRNARFVQEADEAVSLGDPTAYLDGSRILAAAQRSGADAIHPGYGFLSENESFARAVENAGIIFIGPTPETIASMGSKVAARRLMQEGNIPVVPGYDGDAQDDETLTQEAERIGYPVLVKASAGGGGKGMRVVREPASLAAALATARREAAGAFGDDTLLLERYLERPRHIEIQILGDSHGNLVHCFERECSIQRRHQKIIEETPAPGVSEGLRRQIAETAVNVGKLLSYRSAGTVEFILDASGDYFFLEVNTRLQVEHPVTEQTTGLDLVELQLKVASGATLPFFQEDIEQDGHSLECRIYAEDPETDFLPSTGHLWDWHFPDLEGLRIDSGVRTGDEVSVHYDPMLAKIITWGTTRDEATRRMLLALKGASIQGVTTNQGFLITLLEHDAWHAGETHTGFISEHFPPGKARNPEPSIVQAAFVGTLCRVHKRRDQQALLPSVPLGYRNNRWRMADESWRVGDEEQVVYYEARGDREYGMTLGDVTSVVRLDRCDGAEYDVTIDGYRSRYRVTEGADAVFVQHRTGSVRLDAVPRFPDTDALDMGAGCIAPMPGKVLQVMVEAGDSVSEGDPVAILEAMKMEHTICAPADAVVASVPVTPGELVEAKTALVIFEQ